VAPLVKAGFPAPAVQPIALFSQQVPELPEAWKAKAAQPLVPQQAVSQATREGDWNAQSPEPPAGHPAAELGRSAPEKVMPAYSL
jgi:hypothetical protein